MITHRRNGTWVIFMTVIVAIMLNMVKPPTWAIGFRPEWLPLVIIYWSITFPERIGMGVAWLSGLCMDIFRDGAIGGQYALAMVVVSYITLKFHQRLRIHPIWQQALTVFFLILTYQFLLFVVKGMGGTLSASGWRFWATSVTSAAIWPLVYLVLSTTKNRFRLA